MRSPFIDILFGIQAKQVQEIEPLYECFFCGDWFHKIEARPVTESSGEERLVGMCDGCVAKGRDKLVWL